MSNNSPAATKEDIGSVLSAITALDKKADAQFEAMGTKIDSLDQKANARFGAMDGKLDERINDVLGVPDVMMSRIDERFKGVEGEQTKLQAQIHSILNHLDSIEKRLEISDDERLVMAHQLTRLHEWVERAAKRINVEFVH